MQDLTEITLRDQRIAAGLSQRALAALAGVRAATICEIESGRRQPHPASLMVIRAALRRASARRRPPVGIRIATPRR